VSRQLTTSRVSRNRRMVAMSIWLGLIMTAIVMWNSRTQHVEISSPPEFVVFLLAAFTAFVGLFAWMLFNPARGVSAETTTLMLAGAATLFPPCIIAFWTMPAGSPLSGWLTAGLFVLLVIAVMSPVPEEFFGIPRNRHTYVEQVSMFGLGDQSILDQHPDWFQSTDLTVVVPESNRPSLAPNSWCDQAQLLPRSEHRRRIELEADEENPAAEIRPSQKRKGIFGRLRDRRSSFRDSSSGSEKSPSDEKPSEQQQASPIKLTEGERTDRPQSKHDQRDPFYEESSQHPDRRSLPSADSAVGRMLRDDGFQIADQSRQTEFARVTDEFGGETIEGTVTIRFDHGQKRANVHVPFSPPLSGRPDVECNTVDDNSIRVKVPERRAWGLRIEGRRTDSSTIQESEIVFLAVYVPSQ